MKRFDVETILDRNESGDTKQFKSYQAAKKYAIKQSLLPGVIESFISGEDADDCSFEVCEYWEKGKRSDVSPRPYGW